MIMGIPMNTLNSRSLRALYRSFIPVYAYQFPNWIYQFPIFDEWGAKWGVLLANGELNGEYF
jgi:hypothetical protein